MYQNKPLKRVHINTSFVIIFYEENNIVYFLKYKHPNDAYK